MKTESTIWMGLLIGASLMVFVGGPVLIGSDPDHSTRTAAGVALMIGGGCLLIGQLAAAVISRFARSA